MNKYLLLGFSVLLLCATAQSLVCRVCKYKLGTLCFKSDEPCRAKEGQLCETTEVYSDRVLLFKTHGCGKYAELCNRTEERDNAFKVSYKRSCCDADLCNV
ncbi:lymphocyte antigen 6 complex locus protein G6c-like [Anolis sagrei]|uniref:lymphocyte antigen 6 complex locus protein G6c-like n=1 Tax=Anolis sagrei TaxID=38937 RepID=UPI00295B8AD7|nr:lymphocyte antigen 6 complex locus protein G6c-like [Anolis sagrei ordinatus]XP_060617051.1 lymphocyte antigen 6 complex locus protein G6c-like [Anolis sagrei ordinatus]